MATENGAGPALGTRDQIGVPLLVATILSATAATSLAKPDRSLARAEASPDYAATTSFYTRLTCTVA